MRFSSIFAGKPRRTTLAATALATAAIAATSVLGVTPAHAATSTSVTYVATAIDSSRFSTTGGTITVTYTPTYADGVAPDLSACGGGSLDPFTIDYSVSGEKATNAWSTAPSMSYTGMGTGTDHTTNGVNALQFHFNMTTKGTLAANTGWTPSTTPLDQWNGDANTWPNIGYFDWNLTNNGGTLTTDPYTVGGKFVPTGKFTVSGGKEPSVANASLGSNTWFTFFATMVSETTNPNTLTATHTVTEPAKFRTDETSVDMIVSDAVAATASVNRSDYAYLAFRDITGTVVCDATVVDTPMVDPYIGGIGLAGVAGAGAILIARRRKETV